MSDSTKVYSSKQEHLVADILNWEVVAGSGAAACYPGDVKSDEWLGECKTHTTPGKQIMFKKDVWDKICMEATYSRRHPVLITDDGSQKSNNTWCLFLREHLRLQEVIFTDISKYCKVNISFSGESMKRTRKSCRAIDPGKPVMFNLRWGDQDILVCTLEDFNEATQL